jgi:SPX domain protein involved in polyphosphate accumulation
MRVSRLQKQRFEYKYITNELRAIEMRHFIESYLDLDEFGATQHHKSYPIHSIYLDSHNLQTYTDTINGNRNRYKLRIRYYENGNETPVYLEVKRRFDKVIAKKRAVIHRDVCSALIYGETPSLDHLVFPSSDQFDALQHFCNIRTQINATPKIHIAYMREAYESVESNSVRVTFDRQVISEAINSIDFRTILHHPVSVFGSKVILELKFTDRYPLWFKEIVQAFNLQQGSAAKYVDGLLKLRNNHLNSLNYS